MNRIFNIGTHELLCKSTALTAVLYKQLFNEDILDLMGGLRDDASKQKEAIEAIGKLAFIMVKQGEGLKVPELFKLTMQEYYEWLNTFDYGELTSSEAIAEIMASWTGNLKSTAEGKNSEGAQQDR